MNRHIPEDQISAYLDRQLDHEAMARVEDHLRACAGCRSVAEEMSAITEAYRSAESLELPQNLWTRIAAAVGEPPSRRRWSMREWFSPVPARPSWIPVPALILVLMISLIGTVLLVEYRSASQSEKLALAQIEATQRTMASLNAEKHNPFRLPAPGDAKMNPFARKSVDPLINPFSVAQQDRQQERQP